MKENQTSEGRPFFSPFFKVEEGEKVVSVTRLSDEAPVPEVGNGNGEEGPAPDA